MDLLPKVELAPEVKPPLKIEPLPVEQPRPNQTQPAPLSVVVELLEARKPLPAEQPRIDQSPAPLSAVVELLKATEPADKPIRATTILILINVLVAAVMMIYTVAEGMKFPIFDRSHLLVFGADYGPYTLDYQYWRVITSSFLHWGFYHLFINMVALGFFGEAIDRLFDKTTVFVLYVLTGMGSSLLSLFWSVAISAGASGAIFGFVGILVCVLPFARPRLHWFYLIGLLLVLGDLLYGLATPNSPDSHVDTAGHLGGLLAGLLIGCMLAGTFRLPIAQRSARQYRRLVYATAVLFILFGILAFVRHDVVELKRGELLLDKNLPEAIIHLQRFVSHYPNEPDAHLFLGAAYARSQRFRQAADEWKRSLDIAPHNPKLQVSLAGLYVLLGRNDEAIPLFRQGIPELPPNSATYCAFSKALMTTGKLDEAEEMAQKAVSLDPKCSECQAQLQLVKDVRSTTAKMMADIEAKQSKAEKLKAASGRKK